MFETVIFTLDQPFTVRFIAALATSVDYALAPCTFTKIPTAKLVTVLIAFMVCALAVSASCRLTAAKFYTPSGSYLRAILDAIRDAHFVRIILGARLVSFIPELCFNSGALPIHEILPVQEEMPRNGCHGYT